MRVEYARFLKDELMKTLEVCLRCRLKLKKARKHISLRCGRERGPCLSKTVQMAVTSAPPSRKFMRRVARVSEGANLSRVGAAPSSDPDGFEIGPLESVYVCPGARKFIAHDLPSNSTVESSPQIKMARFPCSVIAHVQDGTGFL
jgi:hypothetical protein